LALRFFPDPQCCFAMSEYQYYEFQTVGRRLTEKEMTELRAVSSRAEITTTGFTNEYNFGSFKGDPDKWMEDYFDTFLYLANWGTREFQVALPPELLPVKTIKAYCSPEGVSVRETSGKVIVKFQLKEEPSSDWLGDEGNLSSLLPVREELARGDYRILYLGWLVSLQTGNAEEEALEPEVPPNLKQLTNAQSSFVEFFKIDPDLLEAAAGNSPRIALQSENPNELSLWVKSLPGSEKDTILTRLLTDDAGQIGLELQARFHRQRHLEPSGSATKLRTGAELLGLADRIRKEREETESQKAARARD
jgi:hypothetical protein